jgi:hypothetical protein
MADEINNLETLLDLIAEALINSDLVNTSHVENNQKFILNGQLQSGQDEGVLALFQKDIKANQEDLNQTTIINQGTDEEQVIPQLQEIANRIIEFENLLVSINEGTDFEISIELSGGGLSAPEEITEFIVQDGTFSNVSQFIPLQQSSSIVDVERANEYLDTNIFELLPTGDTRQSRIIRFFQELNALLPPEPPEFDLDGVPGVDRDEDDNWIGSEQYSQDNSISYAQDNPDESNIGEENAYLHRLKQGSGAIDPNDTNSTRTIEDIYNTIEPYLTDILEETPELENIPTYTNQSSGYLQFRNPNQGIIIRNTNQEFIEGLDPNNPTWLTSNYTNLLNTYDSDSSPYPNTMEFLRTNMGTGFTITMWVRFLDKVSNGTLFNYGNPTRKDNPFGFKLETFVINKDDTYETGGVVQTFGDYIDGGYHQNTLGLFQNTNTERFVRLQVREFGDFSTGNDEGLRDSAVGMGGIRKFEFNPPDLNKNSAGHYFSDDERRILNYTNIPEDFNEWYFICATYNPNVNEEISFNNISIYDEYKTNPDFWLNHIDPFTNEFKANSGYGNKCKVEIISRTDLLRARGFEV